MRDGQEVVPAEPKKEKDSSNNDEAKNKDKSAVKQKDEHYWFTKLIIGAFGYFQEEKSRHVTDGKSTTPVPVDISDTRAIAKEEKARHTANGKKAEAVGNIATASLNLSAVAMQSSANITTALINARTERHRIDKDYEIKNRELDERSTNLELQLQQTKEENKGQLEKLRAEIEKIKIENLQQISKFEHEEKMQQQQMEHEERMQKWKMEQEEKVMRMRYGLENKERSDRACK